MPLLILTLAMIFMPDLLQATVVAKFEIKPAPAKKPAPAIVPQKAAPQPKKQAPAITAAQPKCEEESKLVARYSPATFCNGKITVTDPYVAERVFLVVNGVHVDLSFTAPSQIQDKKAGVLYLIVDKIIDAGINTQKIQLRLSGNTILAKRCSEDWKCKTIDRMVYQRANCEWEDNNGIECKYGCYPNYLCKTQADSEPCIETFQLSPPSITNSITKCGISFSLQDNFSVPLPDQQPHVSVQVSTPSLVVLTTLDLDFNGGKNFNGHYIYFNDYDINTNTVELTVSAFDLYQNDQKPCRKIITLFVDGDWVRAKACGEYFVPAWNTPLNYPHPAYAGIRYYGPEKVFLNGGEPSVTVMEGDRDAIYKIGPTLSLKVNHFETKDYSIVDPFSFLIFKEPGPGQYCVIEKGCAPSEFIPDGLSYCPDVGRCPQSAQDPISQSSHSVTVISHGTGGPSEPIPILNKCTQASANNNPKNDRVNLVFVGINYPDSATLEQDIKKRINPIPWGFPGLFGLEPFDWARNKFNVWYVNEIGHVDYYDYQEGMDERGREADDEISRLSQECPFNNQYTVGLIDWVFRDNVDEDTSSDTGGQIYLSRSNPDTLASASAVFAHEFGHVFGHLADEYVTSDRAVSFFDSVDANCVEADTERECLKSPKLRGWIGRGCGDPTKIDCSEEDPSYNNEVRCFKGCTYASGMFRPTFNTIMRDDSRPPYSYGPVNIAIMQNVLDRFKGTENPISMTWPGIGPLKNKMLYASAGPAIPAVKPSPKGQNQKLNLISHQDGVLVYQLLIKYDEKKISVGSLKVRGGYFSLPKSNKGDYEIQLLSKENKVLYAQKFGFPLVIQSAADPSWFDAKGNQIHIPKPEELGDRTVHHTWASLLLPYSKEATTIIISQGQNKILTLPVTHLQACGDNVCSPNEKEQCMADCGETNVFGK